MYLHHGRYVVSQGAFIVRDALTDYDADLAAQSVRHDACMHTGHAQRGGLQEGKRQDEVHIFF